MDGEEAVLSQVVWAALFIALSYIMIIITLQLILCLSLEAGLVLD